MTTTETASLPAGAWSVDRIHSTVSFSIGSVQRTGDEVSGEPALSNQVTLNADLQLTKAE